MEDYSDDYVAPLLNEELGHEGCKSNSLKDKRSHGRKAWMRTNCLSISILFFLILNFIILGVNTASRLAIPDIKEPASGYPDLATFHGVIEYEERLEYYPYEFPWKQEPSDELDRMWGKLLYAQNIRVSEDELDLLGQNKTNRIRLAGSDNYWAALGVYHYLHCLNNLRKVVHWDYYGPRLANSGHERAFGLSHSDHCIDMLRQAVMCRPNTAIYTAEWSDESHRAPNLNLKLDATTTCVNWENLNGWAIERALLPGWDKTDTKG
ncbi:hypothetical protein F5Y13DRAFT_200386 [Hypoxylon sp. FL1857]|nr:hypothetical protein F5Y13DRAFT_200386 [Hypoxylon sp. FL1857]